MAERERRERESRANTNQRLPDNWDSNGTSKGKQSGPVRPTPDAQQGSRKEGERG